MKTVVGELRLKFSATVASMTELRRRCDRVAQRGERLIGCETWTTHRLRVLPTVVPIGTYAVRIAVKKRTAGRRSPQWQIVETLSQARAALAGVSHWRRGVGAVIDHQGEVVGPVRPRPHMSGARWLRAEGHLKRIGTLSLPPLLKNRKRK